MKYISSLPALLIAGLLCCSCAHRDSKPTLKISATTGVYSKKQVEAGSALYIGYCASCHGKDLRGTEGGTTLIGERFLSKWKDKSLGELFDVTKNTMPKTNPHSLDDASYSSLLAFILNANEFPAGNAQLSSGKQELESIRIGSPPATSRVSLRFTPPVYNPKPPTIEAEWLQHRGDYASTNYSLLDQIVNPF